jgi:hypothetical protein
MKVKSLKKMMGNPAKLQNTQFFLQNSPLSERITDSGVFKKKLRDRGKTT